MYKTPELLPKHRGVPVLFCSVLFLLQWSHLCNILTSSSTIVQTYGVYHQNHLVLGTSLNELGTRNDDSQILPLSNFENISVWRHLCCRYIPHIPYFLVSRYQDTRQYPRKPFMISTIRIPGCVVLWGGLLNNMRESRFIQSFQRRYAIVEYIIVDNN